MKNVLKIFRIFASELTDTMKMIENQIDEKGKDRQNAYCNKAICGQCISLI